jgi:hypothetical protein
MHCINRPTSRPTGFRRASELGAWDTIGAIDRLFLAAGARNDQRAVDSTAGVLAVRSFLHQLQTAGPRIGPLPARRRAAGGTADLAGQKLTDATRGSARQPWAPSGHGSGTARPIRTLDRPPDPADSDAISVSTGPDPAERQGSCI